jgi:hypothetical protein
MLVVVLPSVVSAQTDWDAGAAATYLDDRLGAWLAWPNAARDHGTTCVSCHTVLPYALARPSLRRHLAERGPTTAEEVMHGHVIRRVRLWRDIEPYYSDQRNGLPKTSQSRGTEAILNAVVLAARDAETGAMSDDLRTAFSHMWALQMRRAPLAGAWAWLEFGLEPWEGPAATYFGAALAAIAVGIAPGDYEATPAIQEQLDLLREYLRKGADTEALYNRLMILWASTELSGVLEESQRRAIVEAAIAVQGEDGGWSLTAIAPWQRIDGTTLGEASDGYATALAVLALQNASGPTAAVAKGRAWLVAQQDSETGAVPAVSINRERAPATEQGRFMTDAATALAAIALADGP